MKSFRGNRFNKESLIAIKNRFFVWSCWIKNFCRDEDIYAQIAKILGVSGAVIFIASTVIHILFWNNKLGEFGDFLGGFVGSLWAVAGVLLFYSALKTQRKEFERNTRELERQGNFLERQIAETRQTRLLDIVDRQFRILETLCSSLKFRIDRSSLEGPRGANALVAYFACVDVESSGGRVDFQRSTSVASARNSIQEFFTTVGLTRYHQQLVDTIILVDQELGDISGDTDTLKLVTNKINANLQAFFARKYLQLYFVCLDELGIEEAQIFDMKTKTQVGLDILDKWATWNMGSE